MPDADCLIHPIKKKDPGEPFFIIISRKRKTCLQSVSSASPAEPHQSSRGAGIRRFSRPFRRRAIHEPSDHKYEDLFSTQLRAAVPGEELEVLDHGADGSEVLVPLLLTGVFGHDDDKDRRRLAEVVAAVVPHIGREGFHEILYESFLRSAGTKMKRHGSRSP